MTGLSILRVRAGDLSRSRRYTTRVTNEAIGSTRRVSYDCVVSKYIHQFAHSPLVVKCTRRVDARIHANVSPSAYLQRIAARYSGMVHGQQIAAELRSTDTRSDIEFRELFRAKLVRVRIHSI